MAMSLSADDEDYDSDSEQVSTLKALQAGVRRPPEECLCETEQCAASQGSEVMEIPEDKSTDSVYLLCLGFDFSILFFLPLFLFFLLLFCGRFVVYACVRACLHFYYQINPAIGASVYVARGCYWLCEDAGAESLTV